MNYARATRRMKGLRRQIGAVRRKMVQVQKAIEPEEVADYTLQGPKGELRLSQLFGDKRDLFVIHNMGASCPYCTLWADGYNGVYHHLADRAAFVVASPDPPRAQAKFARSRGWRFPMVSHAGSNFATDMGYGSAKRGWMPGVSVFQRKRGKVVRVSDTGFSPGDDFCALWHFFGLLPEGPGLWAPKYKYKRA